MYRETHGPEDGVNLVCLHGGIGTGRYHWGKLTRTLARTHRVHLPDLPGHGHTPLPEDGHFSREVLADAVEDLLEEFDEPAHVAAFSMGGHTCLHLAQHRSDLFASLTLIGVSVRHHEGLDGWRRRFDPDKLERDFPLWARQLSRIHTPLGGPDAWKDVSRRDSKELSLDIDVEKLAGLQCPVLLVRGDRDEAIDPSQYAELRRIWPQADEFVVPAAGHEVQITRHRLLRAPLLDFLQRACDR